MTDHDGERTSSPTARLIRSLVVVATGAVIAVLGLSGTGLLVPSQTTATWTRAAGLAAAIICAGVLLRREGPARAAARLVTVAVTAAIIAALSFPASPVALTLRDEAYAPGDTGAEGTEGTVEPPTGGDGSTGGDGGGRPTAEPTGTVLRLPADASIGVDGTDVTLTAPDGRRFVLGETTAPVTGPPPEGVVVVILDGDGLQRSDGGSLGRGTALGGVTFERSEGGQVVVAEGALLPVPGAIDPEPDAQAEADAARTDAILAVLLGAFALLAFAPPVVRFGGRERVVFVEPEPEVDPERGEVVSAPTATVEEGLADVLRQMLTDPDPRTAVIGAYARLLAAMADAGHPRQGWEGPHEHLWRTLGPLGVRRQPVHRLAELFVRARFTPKPITEAHRQRAIGALADTVADLRLHAADLDVDDVEVVAAELADRAPEPERASAMAGDAGS